MSTNGDDPAGIQREKPDVKPRMSQTRLGTSAAPNPSSHGRYSTAAAPSQRPANTVLSQRAVTSTPSTASLAIQHKRPLFRPRDTQSPEQDARNPIKVDDENDDDSLWAEIDAADPSFTQEAMKFDEPSESAELTETRPDMSSDTPSAGPEEGATVDGYVMDPAGAVMIHENSLREGPDIIDMSLDDDTEDSVYLSGRSKRPRKVKNQILPSPLLNADDLHNPRQSWQLGL